MSFDRLRSIDVNEVRRQAKQKEVERQNEEKRRKERKRKIEREGATKVKIANSETTRRKRDKTEGGEGERVSPVNREYERDG